MRPNSLTSQQLVGIRGAKLNKEEMGEILLHMSDFVATQ